MLMKNFIFTLLFSFIVSTLFFLGFVTENNSQNMPLPGVGYINQGFENPVFPPAGWTLQNTSGYNWVRTAVCSGYGVGIASAKIDFMDIASGNLDLITSTLVTSVAGDSLIFDHAYATFATEVDQLVIYTSSNNGSAWNLLVTLAGGASGPLVTAPPSQNVFVPTSSQWATKRYSLPVGTNKIKFNCISAYGNNLYMDNIRIGSPNSIDVGANSITVPKIAITMGTVTPKAYVKNFGSTTQSFNVTYTINPGGYTNTQAVSNLAAGQSQLITFSNYSFTTNGTYTLKAFTSLASDQNNTNDTVYSSIIVTPSPRNVVLEYCTGTWCQWCPCGKEQALMLQTNYPNSIILAYHGSGSDPWINFNGNGIIGSLGLSSYPSGLMDRHGIISWGSFFTDGENRYMSSPAAPVNIVITNQTYNSSTRLLTVNLSATALETLTGNYYVNYVITEDNMVYNQTGNGSCVGGSNYVHYWVVRNMVNSATGETVNTGGTWTSGQTITKSFNTTLDASWIPANCKLQVFVYKSLSPLNTAEIQQGIKTSILVTGMNNENNILPLKYELSQNFPNPFNPVTNIKFGLPKSGNASLKIYDITGKLVQVCLDGYVNAGYYNAEIDGTTLSSGVYFYKLISGNFSDVKRMILVK
jgi:hypothetical protein